MNDGDEESESEELAVVQPYPSGRKFGDFVNDLFQMARFTDVVQQQCGFEAQHGVGESGGRANVLVLNNMRVSGLANVVVIGDNNKLSGSFLQVLGNRNRIWGPDNRARGVDNELNGPRSQSFDTSSDGASSSASGDGSTRSLSGSGRQSTRRRSSGGVSMRRRSSSMSGNGNLSRSSIDVRSSGSARSLAVSTAVAAASAATDAAAEALYNGAVPTEFLESQMAQFGLMYAGVLNVPCGPNGEVCNAPMEQESVDSNEAVAQANDFVEQEWSE